MPKKLFCSMCDKVIPIGDDYFDVYIIVEEAGRNQYDDEKDRESESFCEDCVDTKNVSKFLYDKLNKRNPNPDRVKK